jgi:mitochondrial chaperone BCS1
MLILFAYILTIACKFTSLQNVIFLSFFFACHQNSVTDHTMNHSLWSFPQPYNSTTRQQFVKLPTNLLEVFIPGYGIISSSLGETFGFDITLIVSISFLIFALFKSVKYLRHQILSFLTRFGTCYVTLDSTGDAYYWLMYFLRHKGVGKYAPGLLAVSSLRAGSWQSIQNENIQFEIDGVPVANVPGTARESKPRVRYEPDLGVMQYFWHKGRLFL